MLSRLVRARPLAPHRGLLTPRTFVEQYQLPSLPGFFPSLLSPARSSGSSDNPELERPVWPALARWSHRDAEGRETLAGMRCPETESVVVPVEVSRAGRGYNAHDRHGGGWDRIELPFGIFLDAFIAGSIPWHTSPIAPMVGYMAQFDLLSSSPSLSHDAPRLPYTVAGPRGAREQWRSNVWIGPSSTFTPLHRDPYENLFVQVVGRKRIHIFPPTAESSLYLNPSGPQSNTSQVEMEEALLDTGKEQMEKEWPLLEKALGATLTAAVEVGPGDAMFIPRGWFHCVMSLETSVSVNWWFR
ncbi:hypothetical protein ACQY0O_001541 [Thecaphora frezii]